MKIGMTSLRRLIREALKDKDFFDYSFGLSWKDEIIKNWNAYRQDLESIYPGFAIKTSGRALDIVTDEVTVRVDPTDFGIFDVKTMKSVDPMLKVRGGTSVTWVPDEDDAIIDYESDVPIEKVSALVLKKIKEAHTEDFS